MWSLVRGRARDAQRHGGTVEKFVGDAVMAVFGIPAVHEDDALRAVRAAAELRTGLGIAQRRARARLRDPARDPHGVNTGEVVAGEGETLATGDRGQRRRAPRQAAEPGETLLGEQTLRLAGDAVDVEPWRPWR